MKIRAERLLRELSQRHELAEVYCKRSRSRTTRQESGVRHDLQANEEGTALRAGEPGRSFFAAFSGGGYGAAGSEFPWPPLGNRALRLATQDEEPVTLASIDDALLGPAEISAFLETVRDQLQREARDARLLRAVIEDGVADHLLLNSVGVEREWTTRTGALLVEAELSGRLVRTYHPAPSAKGLRAQAVARRVAASLHLARDATRFTGDRCELVLAPRLAAELLAVLWRQLPRLANGHRPGDLVAGERMTLLEDGRLDAGPLRAACDGIGQPTRRTVLLENGRSTAALHELGAAADQPGVSSGGWWQRPSWRDAPRFGPTHLCIAPDVTTAPGSLLGSVVRGVYLLDAELQMRRDGSVSLDGRGYAIRRGRAQQSIGGVHVVLSLPELLLRVRGVGRDLEIVAGPLGCFAAPTLMLSRLVLSPAEER